MSFLDYAGLNAYTKKLDGLFLEKQDIIKEITKAQYDALTEEEKNSGFYIIKDASISLNDRGEVYSTDETRIGTWIDGKPVYRKVLLLDTTISGNGGSVTIADVSGFNINEVTEIYGLYNLENSELNYTAIRAINDAGLTVEYHIEDKLFIGYNYVSSVARTFHIKLVIEYTKTTDSVPTIASLSTQSVQTNELEVESVVPERVLTSQVPLPSYVQYAPASASASSVKFSFAKASASSARFTFSPASASSASLTL